MPNLGQVSLHLSTEENLDNCLLTIDRENGLDSEMITSEFCEMSELSEAEDSKDSTLMDSSNIINGTANVTNGVCCTILDCLSSYHQPVPLVKYELQTSRIVDEKCKPIACGSRSSLHERPTLVVEHIFATSKNQRQISADDNVRMHSLDRENHALSNVDNSVNDDVPHRGTVSMLDVRSDIDRLGIKEPPLQDEISGQDNHFAMKVKTAELKDATMCRPQCRTSTSVNYVKEKLFKHDTRSRSAETSSVSISIDDFTPFDDASRRRHSADKPYSGNMFSSGFKNNLEGAYDQSSLDSEYNDSTNSKRSSSFEHPTTRDHSTNLEIPSGEKRRCTKSLDVPEQDGKKFNQSLSTPELNIQSGQHEQFQVVDKLISSKISKTEFAPGQRRRQSWTPESTSQCSNGSLRESGNKADSNLKWPEIKDQNISKHHSYSSTLDALVCRISLDIYEHFERSGQTKTGQEEAHLKKAIGESLSEGIKDGQVDVERADGSCGDIVRNGAEYIADPAGDPFAHKSRFERTQATVQRIVENVYFRAFTVFLILTDFIIVIVDLALYKCASNDQPLEIVAHIIIIYFVFEISGRMFYQGRKFFNCWFDVIDLVVVVVSFVVDVVFMVLSESNCAGSGRYAQLVVIGRVVRIIRVLRIVYIMIVQHRQVARATRQMVSQNKRRYQKDGFDLDLCYITERVIAMSFPSEGLMALYRNPAAEVANFFNTKHKGHYRIYNLCSERDYNESLFFNNVVRVFIDDHNVPKLRELIEFASNAREWMAADKQNVIAIHCKGGKGRTGTMICTWLIDSGLLESAQESLEYFGDRRTDFSKGSTFQGVETPSQSRYVSYYERLKNEYNSQLPPKKVLKLVSIKITGINSVGNGDGSDLFMELRQEDRLIFSCNLGTHINCQVQKDDDSIVINLKNCPSIYGDIKIMFKTHNKHIPNGYDKCPFYFWFYTSFVEDNRLYIPREELDNPHKKKTHHVFRENFAVELIFDDAGDS